MARTTIDYGIDLGTTNSVITRLSGMEREIIKNNKGGDCTPSVVWINRREELVVGQLAKERQESDELNVAYEFKKQMGKDWAFTFERNGRRMRPEELSAEVLKALRQNAEKRDPEGVQGAVITVPAAFALPQCEATKKAATLAGFSCYPLLQEPVAAALAYGFQSESDKVYWLVYDLGGGTFDAAVTNMRDGMFHVVSHLGDNELGGTDIDWAIVGQLLVPALTKERKLTDFRRGQERWREALGKLKLYAEEAKIQVSHAQSADIDIEFLCKDDRGDSVEFYYELKRSDVERLAEPIIQRTIDMCRDILEETHLGPGNIEKVLLVGGPTLTPYLRQMLSDSLGIPLATERDPLTVVAEGAAIFAGTQRVESVDVAPPPMRGYAIKLDYKPLDSDPEPLIGGQMIAGDGRDLSGHTIEFANTSLKPAWRSGKVGLSPDGKFMTQLYAEKGLENVFHIEAYDPQGSRLETTPDRFSYRVGVSVSELPLTSSLGVALANDEVAWFFKKGTPLPARNRVPLRTSVPLRRGQEGDILHIPLLEGESLRAPRNEIIGALSRGVEILRMDVPAGSDVEVTVAINESRIVTMKVFVPILDEEFEEVFNYDGFKKDTKSGDELRAELDMERERLNKLRDQAEETADPVAQQALQRVYSRRMIHEVEDALAEARDSEEVAQRCHSRLRELKVALDKVEDALEWPVLVAKAEKEIDVERGLASDPDYDATAEERQTIARLEAEIRRAIAARDPDLLRQKVATLDAVGLVIVFRHPGWWVNQVDRLEGKKHTMSDQSTADACFGRSRRAIQDGDVEELKNAVRQLWRLLPEGDSDRSRLGSTVMMGGMGR